MVKLLDGTANTVKIFVQFIKQYTGVYANVTLNSKEYESTAVTSNEATFTIPREDVEELNTERAYDGLVMFFNSNDEQIAIANVSFSVVSDKREVIGYDTVYATIGAI